MMTAMRKLILGGLWKQQDGAVLTEALLAVPFVALFAAGILEFGNIFWERMQIDAGLRDAGRYLARCRPPSPTPPPPALPPPPRQCNEETAKTIAFYGTQSPSESALPRVSGWGPNLTDIKVEKANGMITVSTAHEYHASPLFGWLGIETITLSSYHEERYIGW